jgi:MFS family permease
MSRNAKATVPKCQSALCGPRYLLVHRKGSDSPIRGEELIQRYPRCATIRRHAGRQVSKARAWFAFTLAFLLMAFDFIDRQVVISMFPHLKAEWGISDSQLGGLVSIISITIAVGSLPVSLLTDRWSRVKSIVVMGSLWSLATIACAFAHNYGQLLAARSFIGLGEAGYGPAGGAILASVFPARLRATVIGGFLAAASVGSVLGVVLGGIITVHWGWQAAFGIVGAPGLVVALVRLPLPGGPDERSITTAFPEKGPLIPQRTRPPLLETPFEVFDQSIFTPNDRFFVRWHWAVIPTQIDVGSFRLATSPIGTRPASCAIS